MIKVDKREVAVLREKVPSAHIVTVNKQKKYKKYWAEESRDVNHVLSQLRKGIRSEDIRLSGYYRERKDNNWRTNTGNRPPRRNA